MKKKLIASAAISAALLTGGAAVAATTVLPAYAQSTPQTQSPAPTTTPNTPNQTNPVQHPRLRRWVEGVVKTSADTIGIQPKDLVTELKSGKSIAQVAQEHNVDPQKVIDALVAKADARIDQAVQNGKLTQDRANTLKAKVPDAAAKVVNKVRGQHQTN
jgi:hypothetical protein